MMTFPPRASNQKMPLTVNRFQPGTLSGLLATLNTARALPMEIATRYQPSSCSRFALQSATHRHLKTHARRVARMATAARLASYSSFACLRRGAG